MALMDAFSVKFLPQPLSFIADLFITQSDYSNIQINILNEHSVYIFGNL